MRHPSSALRSIAACAVLAAALLVSSRRAHAQLFVTLTPATQSVSQGGSVTFSGSIQNFGSSAVTINNSGLFFPGDTSQFFSGSNLFTGTIAANSTFNGSLFSVTAAASTPTGTYNNNTFTITDSGGNSIDTAFNLNVTTAVVPAPPAPLVFGAMMGVGSVATALTRRRRRFVGTERSAELVPEAGGG